MPFTVFVDDNYHLMDRSERYTHGTFETYEEALAACRSIVEAFLSSEHRAGMTATELYGQYVAFGEDPFIVPPAPAERRFSAWAYARERCEAICGVPAPKS